MLIPINLVVNCGGIKRIGSKHNAIRAKAAQPWAQFTHNTTAGRALHEAEREGMQPGQRAQKRRKA